MDQITIIQATHSDVEQLQLISRSTFSETFSADNAEANILHYLQTAYSAENLLAELQNKDSAFYFAMSANEVMGYLKLNSGPAQTEIMNGSTLEIERIYVLKNFQGRKVGQLLFEKAMEVALLQAAEFIWLGVWEHNQRAISFYRKNGFTEFDKHIFRLGEDLQTDIMMKKLL